MEIVQTLTEWLTARIGQALIACVVLGFVLLGLRFGWAEVRRWCRVLWVCRVSLASVLIGSVMMVSVPQAQDVFADIPEHPLFWPAFFVLLLILWAFPVHYAARQILETEHWALPAGGAGTNQRDRLKAEFARAVTWVPRWLGAGCFIAVAAGLLVARRNLSPAYQIETVREAITQIELLFLGNLVAATVFILIVVARTPLLQKCGLTSRASPSPAPAASGVSYGLNQPDLLWFLDDLKRLPARKSALLRNGDLLLDLVAFFTMAVFTICFVAVFVEPFLITGWAPRAMFLIFMLGAWIFALTYVAAWSHRFKAPFLLLAGAVLVTLSAFSPRFHDVRLVQPDEGLDKYLALQLLPSRRQMSFTRAVETWMKANGCSHDTVANCPSPIVVAGQGGASRAGFFTASVIGEMLDVTRADGTKLRDFADQVFALTMVSGSSVGAIMARAAIEDAGGRGPDGETDDARSALLASPWRTSPCASPDSLWFRWKAFAKAESAKSVDHPWRHCLQSLMAGDFLSPVFVGLAIRDLTSLRRHFYRTEAWWQDRAALLERAWEQRYDRLVTTGNSLATARNRSGLERRFGYLETKLSDAKLGHKWLPLLFLNGTSVETGRRIVVSDIKAWDCEPPKPAPETIGTFTYLPEAYDLYEVIGSGGADIQRQSQPCVTAPLVSHDSRARLLPATPADSAPDLRFSTAANMSARFPIVSPPGILRNRAADAVDRIVDGGYFENDGLATAADIAVVLLNRFHLEPVIVRITNDPARIDEQTWRKPRPDPSPLLPDAREIVWLQSLSTPLRGLYNTRQGHGAEAAHVAIERVEGLGQFKGRVCNAKTPCPARYIHIAVRDKLPPSSGSSAEIRLPEVSMSWWLSQAVQSYLDAQLDHPSNRCSIDMLKWHLTVGNEQSRAPFTTPKSCDSNPLQTARWAR